MWIDKSKCSINEGSLGDNGTKGHCGSDGIYREGIGDGEQLMESRHISATTRCTRSSGVIELAGESQGGVSWAIEVSVQSL